MFFTFHTVVVLERIPGNLPVVVAKMCSLSWGWFRNKYPQPISQQSVLRSARAEWWVMMRRLHISRETSTSETADPTIDFLKLLPNAYSVLLCQRNFILYKSPAKPVRIFPPSIYNFFLFTQKSSLCKFQLCVRMDEKQPGHLNSLFIIVWETQIERSNLHLDCFSRSKLINTATQPTHLYGIPRRVHIYVHA